MRLEFCLPTIACCLIIGLAGHPALAASEMPVRGMHKDRVAQTFGEPLETRAAVGDPPITRWIYEGYTVYYDRDYVIHSVDTRKRSASEAPPAGGMGASERGDADMAAP